MSTSRRRFIGATGAALSAPLGSLGAAVVTSTDDVGAIRTLLHEYAVSLNAVSDDFGARDRIEVGADGRTATASLRCIVETQTAIGPDCPLVDMARQQGGGVVRRRESGVLEARFVKRDGSWAFEAGDFRPGPR